MEKPVGLSSEQVEKRRRVGQGNAVTLQASRPTTGIVKDNAFNLVNVVLYAISLGLALAGDLSSAIATAGLVILNAVVGIAQELRAKRQLDRIALLARGKITVRRDGADQEILPEELVLADLLVIRAGDQMPADGKVISDSRLEMDESALTGESEPVTRTMHDQLLSGTFCTSGTALVEVTAVGEGSFANKLTRNARAFNFEPTPLLRSINLLLRIVLLAIVFFTILAMLAFFVLDLPLNIWLQILAVITGSVSAGLLTLITLNYSWGAVGVGRAGGLIQQINAVESLSNTTVLCTDKTGTLTTNCILFGTLHPVGLKREALESLLGDFAASVTDHNKTSSAIHAALAGTARAKSDEVPFSSARKWSALAFDDPAPGCRGVYVLGALEMLQPCLPIDAETQLIVEEWSKDGLRVLVFAGNAEVSTLRDARGEPALPLLQLLGIVSFRDQLRPHLRETISALVDNGVRLKVISGDNPKTVAALARQAGFPGDLRAVSGPGLDAMTEAEYATAVAEATVFGRISPRQKEALVDALRRQGEYVAMLGDGVNDVLSLKKANLGIAMESGSAATRAVAAIVLLGDSFEVLPKAFREGIRIVNSIHDTLTLFMATVLPLMLLVVAITMLGIGFPFTTLQSTLVSIFARGVPPLILAFTATATRRNTSLAAGVLQFTVPASVTLLFFSLLIYIGVHFAVEHQLVHVSLTQQEITDIRTRIGAVEDGSASGQPHLLARVASAQTALTTFFVLAGVLLLVFARPPVRWLAGGSPFDGGGWLPTIAAGALTAVYALLLSSPTLRAAFDLVDLPPSINAWIVVMTLFWAVATRFAWRVRLLERFLGLESTRPSPA